MRTITTSTVNLKLSHGRGRAALDSLGKAGFFTLWHYGGQYAFEFEAGAQNAWRASLLRRSTSLRFLKKMTLASPPPRKRWLIGDRRPVWNASVVLRRRTNCAFERGVRACISSRSLTNPGSPFGDVGRSRPSTARSYPAPGGRQPCRTRTHAYPTLDPRVGSESLDAPLSWD